MAHLDALFDTKPYIGPESLTSLCYKFICSNFNIMLTRDKYGNSMLREGIVLPSEICDKLIQYVQKDEVTKDDNWFVYIFNNLNATTLKRVKINTPILTNAAVKTLTSHNLTELELYNCGNLTKLFIDHINEHSKNLQTLAFRGVTGISPRTEFSGISPGQCVFKTPNLKSLTLEYLKISAPEYLILLTGLKNLTHLDLSNNFDIRGFYFYSLLPNLVSLTLYNVVLNNDAALFAANVCQLKNLRHLDISQDSNKFGHYENPNAVLSALVKGLPNLMSLDISGTNLAGTGVAERMLEGDSKQTANCEMLCDIPGLASRVNRPLRYLGLYGTAHDACRRYDIPAEMIAGDANEEQILLSAKVCMLHKQDMLQKVLNDLYHIFRSDNCKKTDQALCAVLEAMEKHPSLKYIQISGSATLFYIVKSKDKTELVEAMKRRIIGVLLAGMSTHKDEETMMRNGCLTLCQFRIPQDVMWNYEALVRVLLYSVKNGEPESFVQRVGIYLLNSLACQVEGREKCLLGELGCVGTMLQLVEYRVKSGLFDDVLEVAWSTMWNMTDETPINCRRFLEKQGMDLFLKCVKQFPNREELLRNMMGLLGNVAEVQELRVELMNEEYVSVFAYLLRSESDGIEVSYNAAGILAHMASDGVKAWTIDHPTRKEVLDNMVIAIDSWNMSAERNINYRSFLPLFRLLDVYNTPECQHWAVWALANLTKVYPEKYCSYVMMNDGMEKLSHLLRDPRPYDRIKMLAQQVMERCTNAYLNGT